MEDAPDFYFDSVAQVQLERWSKGRVALVGDAAYCPSPASGQGTSLALVGAYVLAGELAAAGGDHATAFARAEEKLRPYVSANLRLGQKMVKDMVPTSRFVLWLRKLSLRTLPLMPWKDAVIRAMVEPVRQAANAILARGLRGRGEAGRGAAPPERPRAGQRAEAGWGRAAAPAPWLP